MVSANYPVILLLVVTATAVITWVWVYLAHTSRLKRDNILGYDVVGTTKTGDKVMAKFAITWAVVSVVRSSDRDWKPFVIDQLRAEMLGWITTQSTADIKRLVGDDVDIPVPMIGNIDRVYGIIIQWNIIRSVVVTQKKARTRRSATPATP